MPADQQMAPEQRRDLLLIILTITAGTTDATAFHIGSVFASVITGNVILLGIGLIHGQADATLLAGCALGAYALGVALASPKRAQAERSQRVKQPERPLWPYSTSAALVFELVLLIAFTVLWEAGHAHLSQTGEVVRIIMCGGAMGVQSTAIRRLGGMSTTYLTSTLTGLVESLVTLRWQPEDGRSLAILLAALVGAAAAIALILNAPAWLPAVQLTPLAIVLIGSVPISGPQPR